MKTLLMTGADGFLGRNTIDLLKSSYSVHTLGTNNSHDYFYDILDPNLTINTKYNVVLHAAGKAHVIPRSPADEKLFYDINYGGTVNLCRSLNANPPDHLVFISTVAVYGCEYGDMINEDHELLGKTPYAKSKLMAEQYLTEWCAVHHVSLVIIRPSLLAGIDPPGNLGSMIHGIKRGMYMNVGGGRARKSIALASDIARVVPLSEGKTGCYNLCDDYNPSFNELSVNIAKQLKKRKPISIPLIVAQVLAKCGDLLGPSIPINSLKLRKITGSLTFSNEKIKRELFFSPTDVLSNFVI